MTSAVAVLLATPATAQPAPTWSIALHGGAGVIERGDLDTATEAAYRRALATALEAGSAVLRRGGSSMDAVEAAVRLMEDDPLFNAGRGAVFTAEGRNELDAAFMDGATLKAGAVAGVTTVRNPITLARAIMERSPHVMLIGPGAERFAAEQKLDLVPPSYFFTERRWQGLERDLKAKKLPIPARPAGAPRPSAAAAQAPLDERKFGTVGVVARDTRGRLAAGTSTGGMTGKRWGRVGDVPVIGAGTYAEKDCAVSATGSGEYFIRLTVAREICALHAYKGLSIQAAADEVIQKRLTALGGDGGVIALDGRGTSAFSLNTSGMYRARAASNRPPEVAIYKDEGARR
jgi:beta-aspartyl-peptidase (threonine type)